MPAVLRTALQAGIWRFSPWLAVAPRLPDEGGCRRFYRFCMARPPACEGGHFTGSHGECERRLLHLPDTFIILAVMSKAEILTELPKLDSGELQEIHDRILQLEEEQLLNGRVKPSEDERKLLDRELTEYERDPDAGSSWEKVQARLKR